MLKNHESYDRTVKPVVCRDTCHEHHGLVCNSSNTRQLGCVFQEMEPPKSSSFLWKSWDMRKPHPTCKSHKSHNSQWRSADAWGHSVCQRIGFFLTYESPREHASSFIARKALLWKRIFLWMDQWSKTTSHEKRDSGYNATRRTSLRSWFQAFRRVLLLPVLILQPQWHLQDKRVIILHFPQARLPSPTTTASSDSETREREDQSGMTPLKCLCQIQMLKRW